jgi:pimeloyl-ACP methyl ester carboxylesterase
MSQTNKQNAANLRPVMNPTFEKWEVQRAKIAIGWHHVVDGIKWVGRYLLRNPFAIRKTDEPRVSPWKVVLRMGISWAIFLPTATVVTAVVMVVQGTHPAPPPAVLDPNSQGCYFENLSFTSADGAKLSGWMVPALDAHRVVIEKDKILKSRRPAIVLVHDFGQSPQQMLALVKPLHQEGVNVFVLALRGCGRDRTAAATFGIKESEDVAAAVDLLRRTTFVDPNRIAVAGIGSGANAAMIAASKDPSIKSVIVANPLHNCDQAIAARVAPTGIHFKWMEPVCRMTFELMYKVHAGELDYDKYASVLKTHSSLVFETADPYVFGSPYNVGKIRTFCRKTLSTQDRPMIGSAR